MEKNKNTISASLKYLLKTLSKKEYFFMSIAIASMTLAGILVNYPAIILGELVDSIVESPSEGIENSYKLILTIFALLGIAEILNIIRKFIVERIATNLEKKQYVRVVSSLLRADTKALYNYRMGGLNVKIHRNVEGVVKLLKISFMDFLPIIVTSGVAFYLSAKNLYIPTIMLVVAISSYYVTKWQIKSQDGIRRKLFAKKEEIGSEISEKLTNIEYVKTSGNIGREIASIDNNAGSLSNTEFLHHKYMMSFDFVKNVIEITGFIAVILLSIMFVKDGSLQVGSVLTFAMLYKSFTTPLKELHRVLDEGYEACMTVEDLIKLNNTKVSKNILGKSKVTNKDIESTDTIIVNNLSVAFGEKDAIRILDNISLNIQQGEKVGFAGESGSGKTTLVKAMIGLVDNFDGEVKIWGKNIHDISKRSLSKYIVYLPQASPIFNGTIKENLNYPLINDNNFDLDKASENARFLEVINAKKGGLGNILSEGGKNMSGGEKQRLLLTTLFMKKPKLAVLDESTSALDSIVQDEIHQSINKLQEEENQTLLVIAHRLRMLKEMDIIYVLKGGKIVEKGTYNELNKNKGSYFSELVDKEKI